jgi:Tfp pilus assembly protein PilF
MRAGNFEQAKDYYNRSLELNPGNDNARNMLNRMKNEQQ